MNFTTVLQPPHSAQALGSPYTFAALVISSYLLLVRCLRYKRAEKIKAGWGDGPRKRRLSTMTGEDAFKILLELQELEFPAAFHKARAVALLKAGGIPSMSRLFAVTGQNTPRNAAKRATDTEILLREGQTKPRDSERYQLSVARINFLHARYRKAGKITDNDLLHTLGDGAHEILRTIRAEEWRPLTEVELCAVGVFHQAYGEDLEIPFDPLPSAKVGWRDGVHFVQELSDWTVQYEKEVCRPNEPSDKYVRAYVDSLFNKMGKGVTVFARKVLGSNLDNVMRESLGIEKAGPYLSCLVTLFQLTRKSFLRYLCLPRPGFMAAKALEEKPNLSGLFHYHMATFQPWYVKPSFWNKFGPVAMLFRLLGAKPAGSKGDRFFPQGYDLWNIGPEPNYGKGREDMQSTVKLVKARAAGGGCPFSQLKS